MPIESLEFVNHTRSVSPEYGAIVITDTEAIIQKRINDISLKQRLLHELIPYIDMEKLQRLQQLDYLTGYEYQMLDAIDEIEFYIKKHAEANQLKKYNEANRPEYHELFEERDEMIINRYKMMNNRSELMNKLTLWEL